MNEHVEIIADRMDRFEQKLDKIGDALHKLAMLESQHIETRDALTRAFNEIGVVRNECRDTHKEVEGRLRSVEKDIPQMKWAVGVVTTTIIGCAGLLLLAVGKSSGVL